MSQLAPSLRRDLTTFWQSITDSINNEWNEVQWPAIGHVETNNKCKRGRKEGEIHTFQVLEYPQSVKRRRRMDGRWKSELGGAGQHKMDHKSPSRLLHRTAQAEQSIARLFQTQTDPKEK